MKRVKPYRIQIVGGFGVDSLGVKRDFREWITGNGSILEYEGKDANDFTVWKIYDENGKLIRVKDWGKNEGAPVYPDYVRVRFGKSGYVEVGFQRRKDGTFYGVVREQFRNYAKAQYRKYQESRLCQKVQELKKCPKWDSLCYAIHLPDETKAAYKAAIDEACRGEYEVEFLRDEI